MMKILVSQPDPKTEKSPYRDIEDKYGVEIIFRPFIKVEQVSAKEFRTQKINILNYSAVIFTSKTAVDHFFQLCKELRINIPDSTRYLCMTESIGAYMRKYIVYRKRKVIFPKTGKIEDLVICVGKHNKENYLIPVSDIHNDDLTKRLEKKKIKHTTAVMYRTVSNDFAEGEAFDYDMLIFFSPAGIASLLKNFPGYEQKDTVIGTLGSATAKAVIDAGLRLDIEAPTETAPSMAAALEQYLKKINPDESEP
ncbi:MAG: uroporphyrinogen-III synthase [Dysgonamonadaceae bacterium]|jgi:uroporphyrinogen-III synthase|nr:uroporphyrinogen-III synthase [Dysgonamonadaceae bacterium]